MTNQDINDYLRLAIMEEVNKRIGKNFECVNDLIDYAKNLEKENELLAKRLQELQSDLSKEKSKNEELIKKFEMAKNTEDSFEKLIRGENYDRL